MVRMWVIRRSAQKVLRHAKKRVFRRAEPCFSKKCHCFAYLAVLYIQIYMVNKLHASLRDIVSRICQYTFKCARKKGGKQSKYEAKKAISAMSFHLSPYIQQCRIYRVLITTIVRDFKHSLSPRLVLPIRLLL